jgi:hypothetical protein
LLAPEGFGQKVAVGVIAGASPTSAFGDQLFPDQPSPGFTSPLSGERFFSPSRDYIVGGTLEVQFNPSWSLEADGLFRTLHMTRAAVLRDGSLNSVSPSPVVTWEFPVLAKYRFQGWRANPFVEAGPSFRTSGNLNGTNPSHVGVTTGVGVEISWRSLKIAPTARYTRWAVDAIGGPGQQARTASNQVELLVGLSSEAESSWHPLGHQMSLGVVFGTNLTGDFRTSTQVFEGNPFGHPGSPVTDVGSSGPRKMIIGPTVDLRLPHRLSVEVDALYRLISAADEEFDAEGGRSRGTGTYVTWEFPVLAKYTFRIRGVEPFIALGPSFRLPQLLTEASPYGVVTGTGMMFRRSRLGIAPSIRFTHWAPNTQAVTSGAARNQTEILVGFSF